MATAVLHNIAILWKEPDPEMDEEDDDQDDVPPEFRNDQQGQVEVVNVVNDHAAVRAEGDVIRERLRANMPPPTVREQRVINRLRD